MNWQNIDPPLEESKIHLSNIDSNTKIEEKQTDDQIVQLKKFQDPAQNIERQACIALLAQFGDLLMNNRITDMTNNVLTEDCEFFLFSSTGRTPAKYCLHPKDLDNLYNGIQIQERIVRERYIDLEKDTAVQFCNFKVLYQGENDPVNEIVSEVFTLKNNKISKYQAFFSKMTPDHKDSDPFEITSKERALLMVKKLNYSVAGKPDLDKLAEFYHEDAKYKIWSWDSQKCFLFGKHDLKENFEKMQENFELKSIVPYAIYTESQIAVGAYIYHLEGKTGQYANKKYIWPNTCFYVFDEDYKITRVSQQGELSLEGEIEAPFEVFTRENFMQKIQKIFTTQGAKADLFYENIVDFKCSLYQFGPDNQPNIGFSQGTEAVERVQKREKEGTSITKSMKLMGSVVDYCDSGYDVVVTLHCARGISDYPGYKYSGMDLDAMVLTKFSFEHGKVVKMCVFLSIIPEPIPSPFDDPSFESITIQPKSTFYKAL